MRFALLTAALNKGDAAVNPQGTAAKIFRSVHQWIQAPQRSRKKPPYYCVDFDGKHYKNGFRVR